jgi:hypothetical protein
MKSSSLRIASPAAALVLAGFVATSLTGTAPAQAPLRDTLAQRGVQGTVTVSRALQAIAQTQAHAQAQPLIAPLQENITQGAQAAVQAVANAALGEKKITVAQAARPDPGYYNALRTKLRWVSVKFGSNTLRTPDAVSRILLAQSAARRAGLHEVGLSYHDVYGIINAETSWVPRTGASKDGTPNLGIAQFEPATARALGLANPHDPVESVHVAALHLKQAAVWSSRRLEGLKLTPQAHAAKLREGVSIYYNLSTKGRNQWNGMNTAKLPVETRRHISNAARGAREAGVLEARIRALREHDRPTALNASQGTGS